jgi:hypothetical protein
VGRDRLEVLAYVQEEDVQRISIGDSAILSLTLAWGRYWI